MVMDHSNQRQQSTHQNQHQQQQHPGAGSVAATTQMAYSTPPPYQTLPIVATGTPAAATVSSPTSFAPQQQLAFHQAHHFHTQQQQQQLQAFWASQMQEIEQTTDFKNHTLPLARIKKIMKADEDVRMISAEAPVIFATACEMFILELTLRSWIHTEENKRRTLQKNDIAAAISRTDVFDFLVDIIPRDELKEEGLGITKAGIPLVGSGGDGLPYYYVPPQAPVGTNGMIMGKPVDHQAALYAGQQHRAALPFMPWPQSHAQQPPAPQQQPSDS